VLYDLGVVSTKEPFGRLVSQGMILGEVEYSVCRCVHSQTMELGKVEYPQCKRMPCVQNLVVRSPQCNYRP